MTSHSFESVSRLLPRFVIDVHAQAFAAAVDDTAEQGALRQPQPRKTADDRTRRG